MEDQRQIEGEGLRAGHRPGLGHHQIDGSHDPVHLGHAPEDPEPAIPRISPAKLVPQPRVVPTHDDRAERRREPPEDVADRGDLPQRPAHPPRHEDQRGGRGETQLGP